MPENFAETASRSVVCIGVLAVSSHTILSISEEGISIMASLAATSGEKKRKRIGMTLSEGSRFSVERLGHQ